ncbi:hypothetical protein [Sphingobium estronivorans]|uniref:hypothetical protein n=1 Tax=Sphingobium estronivorans TaxID=1577690 RepID=UPI001238FAB0|nr:hypothetical protein [Sphingobium estronivorans]
MEVDRRVAGIAGVGIAVDEIGRMLVLESVNRIEGPGPRIAVTQSGVAAETAENSNYLFDLIHFFVMQEFYSNIILRRKILCDGTT